MDQEQTAPIPSKSPEATSAEKERREYDVITDKLIERVDQIDTNEESRRKTVVHDFLLDIVDRADAGEVTGSTGNVYDKDQILIQFSDYLKESSQGNPAAIRRIPSFNGMRDAIARLANDERTSSVLADALDEVAHGPRQESQPDRAAEAARTMLAIEDEIDHRSIEIAEEEPRITEEQAEKIGEEVLEVADVEDPAELEQEEVPEESLEAPVIEEKPLKFDINAAMEKMRLEDEARLIPNAELGKAQPIIGEMLRQFGIAMDADNQQEAQAYRHNLESALVQESRSTAERVKRGDMNALVGSLVEGMIAGSARTVDGLDAVMSNLHHSELYSADDLRKIADVAGRVREQIIQRGGEGEHFARLGFDIEQEMYQHLEAHDRKPDKTYATLIGMLIGATGRLGRGTQYQAYSRMQGGIDHLGSFKK